MYLPVCRREIDDNEFIQAWIAFCQRHFGTQNRRQAMEFNMPLLHRNAGMAFLEENELRGLDMLLRELSGDLNRKQVTHEFFASNNHIILRNREATNPATGRHVFGATIIEN